MKESSIVSALEAAYLSPKLALPPLDWKPDRNQPRILRIPIARQCSDADVIGVSIIGTAWLNEPDGRVTFQMCVDIQGIDYRVARVDWRPRQPHTNRFGPTKGLTAMTSIHDFPENMELGLKIMQSQNLPIVKPIAPEPRDFSALCIYVRDTFRLDNAEQIPVPPWSQPLL